MKRIVRKTMVVSVSLPPDVAEKLEKSRHRTGQSRSAFIASLIEKQTEEERWQRVYRRGQEAARELRLTSEDDIDRLLHARKT